MQKKLVRRCAIAAILSVVLLAGAPMTAESASRDDPALPVGVEPVELGGPSPEPEADSKEDAKKTAAADADMDRESQQGASLALAWAPVEAEAGSRDDASLPVGIGSMEIGGESSLEPETESKKVAPKTAFDSLIANHAREQGVPVALARAVVRIESNYNPRARGRSGEIGLMQIKPQTARGIGFSGDASALYDPDTNLRWGMSYLGTAYKLADGSVCGTILRYQGGHYAKRMTSASRGYCQRVQALMGGQTGKS